MRPLILAPAAVLFATICFWAGLVAHFPGAAFSRYVESRIEGGTRFSVRMAGAEMGWTSLSIPQVRIDGTINAQPAFLLALTEVEIPLSLTLLGGLTARARVGAEGEVEFYWPWGEGEAALAAQNVRLESIPVLAQLPAKRVQGTLDFDGSMRAGSAGPPEGTVRVRLERVEVGEADVFGQIVALTHVDEARLESVIGASIRLDRLELRGDVQGNVTGSLTPNWARPDQSNLDLNIDLSFRPEWIQQLGSLALAAESFLSGGKLSGSLRGTPSRPNFRNARTP